MNSDTLLLSISELLAGFVSVLLTGALIADSMTGHSIKKSSPEVRSQAYSYSFL
jgi:hypothetical protein